MVRSQPLYYQPFLSHRILLLFLFSLQYRQCWLYEFFFCQNFFPYTYRHLFEGEKGNFQDKRKFILLILALLNNSRKFYNGSCCARQPYGVTKLTLDCLEVQMLFERKTAMPTLKRSVYIISLHGSFDKIHFIFKYLGGRYVVGDIRFCCFVILKKRSKD